MYRKILKTALKITWRNKYLWFFGLFASLLVGGGEYEILRRGLGGTIENSPFLYWGKISQIDWQSFFYNIGNIIKQEPTSFFKVLFVFLLILVLSVFLIWLAVVSQSALVKATASNISNKKNNFKEEVAEGINNFWPVLGINIIGKVLVYLGFLIISLPLLLTASQTGILFYLIFFVIFIPLTLAFYLIMKYAIAFVVIKKENFIASLKLGWNLFIANWLVSIEMAIILFAIYFAISMAIILLLFVLAAPFLFLAIIFYKFTSIIGFWLIVILAAILLLAVIIVGGASLTTYQITSWTTLFIELTGKGMTSKIVRVVKGLTENRN